MRTLLIESSAGVGLEAADALRSAGHDVVRCHPGAVAAFPCTDLVSPGSCPLQGSDPVDVVLVTRAARDPEPTVGEAGVTCAVRAGVPVTVLGHPSACNPYSKWTEVATSSDPVQACRAAVKAAHDATVAPLRDEVVRTVNASGGFVTSGDVRVELDRAGARVHLQITVPAGLPVSEETIATHVHSRFRTMQRGVPPQVIDVAVATRP